MKIDISKESVRLVNEISKSVKTFHHHYHILIDIAKNFGNESINYVEIGTYYGGSASLMIHRPNTNVISIDVGHPAPKNEAISNVNRFNIHDNNYIYIEGNSQETRIVNKLIDVLNNFDNNKIDILFIDGDHSYNGAYNDFINYSQLVRNGGYIVFDDYMDYEHSPEVKLAVDDLVNHKFSDISSYDIIGCLPNSYDAYPNTFKINNCFIIKKTH